MAGTIDPSVLLGARGIQLPDPMALATQSLTLADLANRKRMHEYQMAQLARQDETARALEGALPGALRAGFSDDAITQADPRAQQALLGMAQKYREEQAKAAKMRADEEQSRASARKSDAEVRQKAMRDIANVAAEEAKNPSNLSLSRVRSVAQFYGVPLPQPPTDPRDVNGMAGYLTTLANTAYDIKDRLSLAETARGHDLTATTAREGHQVQREGQQVTKRGQDMTDARMREKNAADARAADALMQGQPQEIDVNGKPVLAIYDRKSGTFFDANTRQPIRGGIGPKQADIPASLREKMAQNEVTIGKIGRAMDLVDKYPDAFGLKNMAGDAVVQRFDPAGVEARALVADIAGQKIHDRSGAAVTVGEMARLRPYIPNVTDHSETVKKKLALFRAEYERIQDEIAKGRGLADMIRDRSSKGATGDFGETIPADAGAPAQREFKSMPDPATLPNRRIQAPDGTIYKSNGSRWIQQR